MKEGYKATIRDGRAIYIPSWPVDVALENVSKAGKILGTDNIIAISRLNKAIAVVALMEADDPTLAAQLIKHFICQVRIDGSKVETKTINAMFEGELEVILELFVHVIHSQFFDFFSLGLAKEPSLEASLPTV